MKETVYFGTYTRRTSQGIYKADFDTETGQLSNLELFAADPSPTSAFPWEVKREWNSSGL